jgi:hypothetical protein
MAISATARQDRYRARRSAEVGRVTSFQSEIRHTRRMIEATTGLMQAMDARCDTPSAKAQRDVLDKLWGTYDRLVQQL